MLRENSGRAAYARNDADKDATGNEVTRWVLIRKLAELTGYSENAIRKKISRGEWLREVHWRKAPDNRLVCNLVAVQRWMGGGEHA